MGNRRKQIINKMKQKGEMTRNVLSKRLDERNFFKLSDLEHIDKFKDINIGRNITERRSEDEHQRMLLEEEINNRSKKRLNSLVNVISDRNRQHKAGIKDHHEKRNISVDNKAQQLKLEGNKNYHNSLLNSDNNAFKRYEKRVLIYL
jgi:hypothetical protein